MINSLGGVIDSVRACVRSSWNVGPDADDDRKNHSSHTAEASHHILSLVRRSYE